MNNSLQANEGLKQCITTIYPSVDPIMACINIPCVTLHFYQWLVTYLVVSV